LAKRMVRGGLGTALLLIVVGGLVVLSYMGFVPGLSDALGTSRGRDLGVRPGAADLASARAKLGHGQIEIAGTADANGSLRFEGSHPVDAAFTSEEFTALQQARRYKHDPLYADQTQVKFNPDGTVETSGRIRKGNLEKYAEAIGIPRSQIAQIKEIADKFPADPTFYAKGTVVVTGGQVTTTVTSLEIAHVPVPADQINQATGPAEQLAEQVISLTPGLSVEEFSVVDGRAHFKGTYPDKVYVAQ